VNGGCNWEEEKKPAKERVEREFGGDEGSKPSWGSSTQTGAHWDGKNLPEKNPDAKTSVKTWKKAEPTRKIVCLVPKGGEKVVRKPHGRTIPRENLLVSKGVQSHWTRVG